MTKTEKTIDDLVKENAVPKESIYNGRYTKTALFLLRMIDLNLQHPLVNKFLYNAFLDDKGLQHTFERPIFLLFKVEKLNDKEFMQLFQTLRELGHRRYDYDLGKQDGHNLVMVVCQTPDKWKDDYYHFKAGRYSKMSDAYKLLFPKEIYNGTAVKQESMVWGALHKSKTLKDRVANIFTVKDDQGNIKDPLAYEEFRKEIDTWDETWDLPKPSEEYYRFNLKSK